MLVTVGTALVTLIAIQYLYRRGMWQPQSALGSRIDGVGGLALLISFVLACVSLAKERPHIYGIIALCLSVLSFLLYVR
jgi:UDP-N-acetylmuramyl pentapeptide phosphotransferase/UDP-N-acetylglucosamine-1-phosphate transferase